MPSSPIRRVVFPLPKLARSSWLIAASALQSGEDVCGDPHARGTSEDTVWIIGVFDGGQDYETALTHRDPARSK
jgi:hypothetical protein